MSHSPPPPRLLVDNCLFHLQQESQDEGANRTPLEQGTKSLPYLCLYLLLGPAVVLLVLVGSQNLLLDAQQHCFTAITPAKETTGPEPQEGLGALLLALKSPFPTPYGVGLSVTPPLPGPLPLHSFQKTSVSKHRTHNTGHAATNTEYVE